MASAQQLIGLVKSHAEGNADRFYDLAMQLAAAEEQKGHSRLAEQLRQWAEVGQTPKVPHITPLAAPRGDLALFLAASYPHTKLNDLILSNKLKKQLELLIAENKRRDELELKGLKPRRRILLSGLPGTGKTLTASAIAGELHYPLFTVMLHGLITKYMGETAQKLKLIFDAVKTTRGIYLFDEIDALAAARNNDNDIGEARRVLNSFLQFLDEDAGPSIIVATTNLFSILDKAILRRFDLALDYTLPDSDAIKQVIKRRLIGFSIAKMDWESIIPAAQGLSPADIVAAAEDAAREAVLNGTDFITENSLAEALNLRRHLQGLESGITEG